MARMKSNPRQRKNIEDKQSSINKPTVVSEDLGHSAGNRDGVGSTPLKLLVVLLSAAVVALSVYAIYAPSRYVEQCMNAQLAAEVIQSKTSVSLESDVMHPALEQKRAVTTEQEVRPTGDDYIQMVRERPEKPEIKENDALNSSISPPTQRVSAEVNSAITSQTVSAQDDNDESQAEVSEIIPRKRSEIDLSKNLNAEEDTSEFPFLKKDEPAIIFKGGEQLREINLEVSTESALHSDPSHPPRHSQRTQVVSQDEAVKGNRENDGGDLSKSPVFLPTMQKRIVPKKVFIDGRRIPPVELLAQKPNNSSVRVYLFNDLLSAEECDSLRKAHEKHVDKSSKVDPIICFDSVHTLRKHLSNVDKSKVKVSPSDFTPGTTCLNATFSSKLKIWLNANWSYSTAFYPGESRFSFIMAQRLKDAMGLMPENGGKFQITSYPLNVGYKSHTDCTVEPTDRRDRMATVLVYLETVNEGGETEFPELGIWVKPRKGRALLWNNMDENGRCEPLSVHQAAKVKDGHKYILQRWYYYESFGALGKRPPEPTMPTRTQGQPRVTCDEYEHGSCRWYDEWNYEHIVEYNRKKHSLA